MAEESGVVVTTYEHLKVYYDVLIPVSWGCVVLDEGHKIRNPDADITLVCKQLKTVHRCGFGTQRRSVEVVASCSE